MIDTHAHLFLSKLDPETYIANAVAAGVTRIVNVATEQDSAAQCVKLATEQAIVVATAGIHPCTPGKVDPSPWLREFVSQYPVVAIGEIGLDGYRSDVPMAIQIERFVAQLQVAREFGLPVIIHCREAAEPMKMVIAKFADLKKVFHCFSENADFINAVQSDTTYFSFTGNISYSNARHSRYAAQTLPLNRIMLETDAPYMTPLAKKGLANESAFIYETAKVMASLRGVDVNLVIKETTETACKFFNLEE